MFILTLKNKPEGVFSVIDGESGDQIIPIFECGDDAKRYQEQLEFQTQRYKLQVLEISENVIIDACQEREQKYAIITEDDFIVPPIELV
jgi:hypothetical protein